MAAAVEAAVALSAAAAVAAAAVAVALLVTGHCILTVSSLYPKIL